MSKIIKVSFPEKCIGCELCIYETQRQLKKTGGEGSPIRIFKEKSADKHFLKFSIDVDPNVNDFNILQIKDICPTGVFEITEEETQSELTK